jgi:hypothetical protein
LPLAAPLLGIAAPGEVGALQVAYAASVTLWLASLAVTSRLPEVRATTREAKHAARRAARPDRVARVAIDALARDPALVPLLAIGAALGAVVMSFESFLPAELRVRWGPEGISMVLGTVMTVAFGATAAGQALAARFAAAPSRVPLARVAQGAVAIAVGAVLIALDVAGPAPSLVTVVLAAAGAWLAYLGLGFANPALAAAFHDRVASGERATMLSVHSLAAYVGGVAATLALGAAAEASGLAVVWVVVVALGGGTALTAAAWRVHRPRNALRHAE